MIRSQKDLPVFAPSKLGLSGSRPTEERQLAACPWLGYTSTRRENNHLGHGDRVDIAG